MTVFELYAAALEEKDKARLAENWDYLRASKALVAFIQVLLEREAITWDDDIEKIGRIHAKVAANEKHNQFTNRLIAERMEKNDREAERELGF